MLSDSRHRYRSAEWCRTIKSMTCKLRSDGPSGNSLALASANDSLSYAVQVCI